MPRSFKRQDKNTVQEIRRYRAWLQRGGEDDFNELFFASVMKFRATAREHCWAMFYAWLQNSPPDAEWMKYYTEIKRQYNRNLRNPDDEIIGSPMTMQTVHGKVGYIWLEALASGQAAANCAKWCEKPRDGYNKKIKRLEAKSRDRQLKARHESHLREIERRARKGKN